MTYIKMVAVLVPVMLIIDAIWIGGVMKGFYRGNLGYVMADTIRWVPAIVFYVLYITGLVYFVVMPGVHGNLSVGEVFVRGAFLGLIAYGAYDLTNHATLKGWPYIVTIVDMVWGALLTGAVAAIGKYLSKWLM